MSSFFFLNILRTTECLSCIIGRAENGADSFRPLREKTDTEVARSGYFPDNSNTDTNTDNFLRIRIRIWYGRFRRIRILRRISGDCNARISAKDMNKQFVNPKIYSTQINKTNNFENLRSKSRSKTSKPAVPIEPPSSPRRRRLRPGAARSGCPRPPRHPGDGREGKGQRRRRPYSSLR